MLCTRHLACGRSLFGCAPQGLCAGLNDPARAPAASTIRLLSRPATKMSPKKQPEIKYVPPPPFLAPEGTFANDKNGARARYSRRPFPAARAAPPARWPRHVRALNSHNCMSAAARRGSGGMSAAQGGSVRLPRARFSRRPFPVARAAPPARWPRHVRALNSHNCMSAAARRGSGRMSGAQGAPPSCLLESRIASICLYILHMLYVAVSSHQRRVQASSPASRGFAAGTRRRTTRSSSGRPAWAKSTATSSTTGACGTPTPRFRRKSRSRWTSMYDCRLYMLCH